MFGVMLLSSSSLLRMYMKQGCNESIWLERKFMLMNYFVNYYCLSPLFEIIDQTYTLGKYNPSIYGSYPRVVYPFMR